MAIGCFIKKIKEEFSWARFFASFIFLIFLLIFFTSLPNYLAQPLIVSPRIQKAEAILVLSGGSYDNGQLSSFSLERLVQAVKLYREGWAPKIIFSGKEDFGDALAMKEIALSLGVPDETILVEDQATSTYENILFSSVIAEENNLKEILLVTSPIHLRRSLNIAEKISPELKFLPASFPPYDSFRRHPLDRFILFWFTVREYLGIIREHFRG